MKPRLCCLHLIAMAVWASTGAPVQAQSTHPAPATAAASARHADSIEGANNADGGSAPTGGSFAVAISKRAYFGIDFGQARYSTGCGFGGYRCKNPDLAGRAHVGGLFNPYVGAELGYVNMGRADQVGGGMLSAQGINLSVLGRLPLGAFNAFVKAGATFGRTEVRVDGVTDVESGKAKGWGGSYGAGLSYEVGRSSALVLEWERHAFRFQGLGTRDVQLTTMGYRYRF